MRNTLSHLKILILGKLFILSVPSLLGQDLKSAMDTNFKKQYEIALKKIQTNISPPGTRSGTVIASPTKEYYFHWVRDGALVLDALKKENIPGFEETLKAYGELSRLHQTTPTASGDRNPGEPKFQVDGTAFEDPWGRPQDDGPATRSILLIQRAHDLLDQGRVDEAKKLYDSKYPTQSVIKTDLEYISHNWNKSSFDLWEEIRGHHFYTRMVQRKALLEGADLAVRMGDPGAAVWYGKNADYLGKALKDHWNPQKNSLEATLNRDGGLDYKSSGLDAAIVLGLLHGNMKETGKNAFPLSHSKVERTVLSMEKTFKKTYPINQSEEIRKKLKLGVAIGRYPEDRYFGGNPWVLTTAAFGEYYYLLALELSRKGELKINSLNLPFFLGLFKKKEPLRKEILSVVANGGNGGNGGKKEILLDKDNPLFHDLISAIFRKGDSYLGRVLYHSHEGSLSEQIHCHSGYMISMDDLTWNYASFLTAYKAREALRNHLLTK